VNSIQ